MKIKTNSLLSFCYNLNEEAGKPYIIIDCLSDQIVLIL